MFLYESNNLIDSVKTLVRFMKKQIVWICELRFAVTLWTSDGMMV